MIDVSWEIKSVTKENIAKILLFYFLSDKYVLLETLPSFIIHNRLQEFASDFPEGAVKFSRGK